MKFKQYTAFMRENMRGIKHYLPIILTLTIILSVISFLLAILSKNMIDYIVAVNGQITIMIPLIISLYVLSALIGYSLTIIQTYFNDRFKIKIQKEFYNNILKSDYVFFLSLSSSDIYYKMFIDISVMVSYYIQLIINLPIKIIVLIVSTIMFVLWSPLICGLFFILIIIQFLFVLLFKNKIKKNYKDLKSKEENLIQCINENCQRIEVIKSLHLYSYCINESNDFFSKYFKQDIKSTAVSNLHSNLISLISQLWNIVILIIGVQLIITGQISFGTIMAISMLTSFISSSINQLFGLIINYQNTIVSFSRFGELYFSRTFCKNNKNKSFVFERVMKINKVSFSYQDKTILYNASLTLEKGKIYLIKGANGSGKTTLCRIIARFLAPQNGEILLDNICIEDFEEESFRKNVIFVNSNPIILNKSIYENLVLESSFSIDDVKDVMKKCNMNDILNCHNINEPLGLKNGNLSQGEIQKISIARALIRKPKILILDEPTAHIDYRSSIDIIKALVEFQKENNGLIIICSHDIRLYEITKNIIDIIKINNN